MRNLRARPSPSSTTIRRNTGRPVNGWYFEGKKNTRLGYPKARGKGWKVRVSQVESFMRTACRRVARFYVEGASCVLARPSLVHAQQERRLGQVSLQHGHTYNCKLILIGTIDQDRAYGSRFMLSKQNQFALIRRFLRNYRQTHSTQLSSRVAIKYYNS